MSSNTSGEYPNSSESNTIIKSNPDIIDHSIHNSNSVYYQLILSKIFDNSSFGIAIIDQSGIFQKNNLALSSMVGYSIDELQTLGFYNLIYQDDIPLVTERVNNLFNHTEHSLKLDTRLVYKTGLLIWFNIEMFYLDAVNDLNDSVLCIFRDITLHKHAELELLESEIRFQQIFEHINSSVIIYKPINNGLDYVLIDINKAGLKYFHEEIYSIVGKSIKEIIPFDLVEDIINGLKKVNATGNPLKIPLIRYINDKIDEWVENYIFKLPSGYLVGIFDDNSEKRMAEFALRESEIRYKHITESIADYIYKVYMLNGEPIQTIHSPACEILLGYKPDEFLTNKYLWFNVIYKHDREKVLTFIKNVLNTREQAYIEHRVYHKDGNIRWVRNNIILFKDNQGNIYEYDGVIQDITDRKNAEEQLILAKEKAEESDRLKTAFLQNMSHEIRTPMNGIMGFAYLLQQNHVSIEQRNQFTSIIIESSGRLLNIVNDILDISKIESSLIDQNIENFYLIHFLSEIYKSFEPKAISLGLSTNIIYPDYDFEIKTDRTKLAQIVKRLIDNALKFTPVGSVTLGCRLENDLVYFWVSDTGIGIEKDKHDIIFERFRQVETDLTRTYGGTGLGLYIAKKLVEFLGGEINVDSEIGKGSTFYFYIRKNFDMPD